MTRSWLLTISRRSEPACKNYATSASTRRLPKSTSSRTPRRPDRIGYWSQREMNAVPGQVRKPGPICSNGETFRWGTQGHWVPL